MNSIKTQKSHITYRQILWKAFRKNKLAVWSLRLFCVLLFIAVFADFLANNKPIYCQYEGQNYFPVCKDYLIDWGLAKPDKAFLYLDGEDWQNMDYDYVIFAPIPYAASQNSSLVCKSAAEAGKQHYLGTAKFGKDVLSILIHGTRVALFIGIFSMLLASLIGVFLGSLAGYFGDYKFRISRARLFLNLLALPIAIFYGFMVCSFALSKGGFWAFGKSLFLFSLIFIVINLLAPLFKRNFWLGQKIRLPLDIIIMRLIEIFNSIPILLFLIATVSIIQKPSIFNIILIIALLRWTSIARFVRSELLRIRELDYIKAAQSMGFSEFRILIRHALPNGLTSVLILIAFGMASAILLEASLSFLGIGVAPDEMTWGKLLADGRQNPSAWWLAIYPGFAIFLAVLMFNLIGEGLNDALDSRN